MTRNLILFPKINMIRKSLPFRISAFLVLLALLAVLIRYGVYPYWPREADASLNPDPNHTHADFAVWIDGEELDFSGDELMSGLSTDDSTHDEEDEYHHQHLHLHDNVGTVIHRHKPGLSLEEFFGSLQLAITKECYVSSEPLADGQICPDDPFRLFVNGEEIPFDMGYVFSDLDQILITNATDEAELANQFDHMTDQACLYSQACPWRGDPPAENCVADPEVPCVE